MMSMVIAKRELLVNLLGKHDGPFVYKPQLD